MVAPDYVGMGTKGPTPYLIGIGEPYSSLDAARAAHQLPGLSLCLRRSVTPDLQKLWHCDAMRLSA